MPSASTKSRDVARHAGEPDPVTDEEHRSVRRVEELDRPSRPASARLAVVHRPLLRPLAASYRERLRFDLAPCTSSGMSSHTGPAGPFGQVEGLVQVDSAMDSGSMTVIAYLVIGASEGDDVELLRSELADPRANRFMSARLTCPEITRQGVDSSHAPATPVIAFVPPGPVVTSTTPRLFVTRA